MFLVFLLCSSYLSAQGNALIVPGKGVGVLELGEPINFIQQDLDNTEPSNWRVTEEGNKKKVVLSYKDFGLTLVFDFETKRLERIIVMSPNLLVEGTGIHVGSSREEVLRYFKNPDGEAKGELDYPGRGIKFILNKSLNAVYAIEVRERKIRD